MSDFAHHDDMRPLESAGMPTAPRGFQPVRHALPDLPNLTREELRASREELLAALDKARASAFVAWAAADYFFNALKGRHLPTTHSKETTK